MKISPFTPLHFSEANRSDGMPSRFIQLWAPTDQILVEVIASAGDTAPSASLNDAHTGFCNRPCRVERVEDER